MKKILEAMQGLSYLEWKKLSHVVDANFKSRASQQANKLEIASPEEIINSLEILF